MKSKFDNFKFNPFRSDEVKHFLSSRKGELRLGEKLGFDIYGDECRYVILGISESIGPQANFGRAGAENGFKAFVSSFVNMQSNRFLSGEEVCLYGEISALVKYEDHDQAIKLVHELDDFVGLIVQAIVSAGKFPIVIGGGHNNAYPIIKAFNTVFRHAIDVVNLDPHADCRALEGRHSGNPFSYALYEGLLRNYAVIGLHENYNNEAIYSFMDSHNAYYRFFEDYLLNESQFKDDVDFVANHRNMNDDFGVELDLDSIAWMPSSAMGPSGLTVEQARYYVRTLAKKENSVYLHLPEGAPETAEEMRVVGKTLAYLVSDFIKMKNSILK